MFVFVMQLVVEYIDNVWFLKIDIDEEYEFCF